MPRPLSRFLPLFSQANDDGNDPPPEPAKLDLKAELAKEGNWEAVARSLAYKVDEREADNYRLRQQKRDLKGQLPPEDALVLTGEDKAAYEALAALGTAEDLKAKLAQADEDAAFRAAQERAAEFAKVAAAAGVNLDALQSAKGADALTYEIEGEGEDAAVYVRESDDAERVELSAYVDEHWAALKPALYGEPAPAKNGAPAKPAVPFVKQSAGGRPPAPPKPADAEQIAQQKRMQTEYAAAF